MIKKSIRRVTSLFTRVHDLHHRLGNLAYDVKCIQLQDRIINSVSPGVTSFKYCDCNVIVSLTSYGRRLWEVCNTIESVMQQTWLPNRIVLWISDDEYASGLPEALKLQAKRGLEVKPTKDIRSYKKLIPALSEYPKDVIITVDDDLLYDFTMIERLLKSYLKDPMSIHAMRTKIIELSSKNKLKEYEKWPLRAASTSEEQKRLFFTTGGGSVFPPGAFTDEVFNQDVFMDICPYADDVWFNAMARISETGIRRVETRMTSGEDYTVNYNVQDMGLVLRNVEARENDRQLADVFDKYDIYRFL